jgi:tRNA modification GTPase
MINKDTICAVSTAPGNGAIAVIRLSGEKALSICDKVFYPKTKEKKLIKQPANTIHFGEIKDKDDIIDEVLVSIFKSPNSYTGEDIAEIFCHGASYIQQKILQLFISCGARMAQAGEFTMRAFLHGKMDLSQAEGVADLIASSTEASHRIAIQQMRGGFSDEIRKLRTELLKFISLIELELDFGEEDVEFANRAELKILIEKIRVLLKRLTDSFEWGNALKNGIPVSIIGEPNVGKSTLLNVLLNDDRAIVSEIPGTTRDSIEDFITIDGIGFRFIDTAGLRKTTDTIETLGIERTHKKIQQSSIVLLLIDAEDIEIATKVKQTHARMQQNAKLIVVINKIDKLSREIENKDFKEIENLSTNDSLVCISAKERINIDKLIKRLIDVVNLSSLNQGDIIVTNARHYEALSKAYEAICRATDGMEKEISSDFLAMDIREVLHYLGEITGEITTDEILGNIFEKFCIGK